MECFLCAFFFSPFIIIIFPANYWQCKFRFGVLSFVFTSTMYINASYFFYIFFYSFKFNLIMYLRVLRRCCCRCRFLCARERDLDQITVCVCCAFAFLYIFSGIIKHWALEIHNAGCWFFFSFFSFFNSLYCDRSRQQCCDENLQKRERGRCLKQNVSF